ncbi:CsgG/HfaB family protein [Flavobacteriales bacterium]|nr:CsgG/HfaB family protein [Flavobacteriales bacterium]MDG1145510.1 CsgG/HfaB family protein [Flavobacteriales bacterium]MDG1395464.1 CsgG/HfaB family protein [Flavobacteriales bacterium]
MKLKNLSFLVLFILVSCTGTKKMTKRALAFEQQGMYTEAANYFLEALRRKSTNIDAAMGLKRTGQLVLDDLLAAFFKSHTSKAYKNSVYAYLKAENYKSSAAAFTVSLEVPSYYPEYYKEDLAFYLAAIYDDAMSCLDKEEFDKGLSYLDEILQLDATYKDVAELKTYARLEPVYRNANLALETKKFRKAYYLFGKTITYKDSDELKAYALKEAQYPIAMLPFENATTTANIHKSFESQFLNLFIKDKNPFIKIIDRVHIETVLNEQELGLSGLVDSQTAAKAGDLFGAKALLVGRLVSYDAKFSAPKATKKKGWESYKQKKYNAATKEYDLVTKYSKVKYNLFQGISYVNLTIEYKLISTETGEILATNLFTDKREDQVKYIEFDGNTKNLLSGTWVSSQTDSESDRKNTGYKDRKNIQGLLKANKNLRSKADLMRIVLKNVSAKAVSEINSYNPEEN